MILISNLIFQPFKFGNANEPLQKLAFAAEPYEGRIQFGVWESGPGELIVQFCWDETVYAIEGEVRVENMDTNEQITLKPGAMMVFLSGSTWRWSIPWKFKKIFTIIENHENKKS